MSFLRKWEIFRSDEQWKQGRCSKTTPPVHRLDEFPAGDPLAGCAPAEPASISSANDSIEETVGQDNDFSANGNLSLFLLSQSRRVIDGMQPLIAHHFNLGER